ncbi:unnamed protein product [[Candida] boidinii]|uniref:Unnamed protein product n=1 Tax=Candida boidinii TaxID=5477 RepID=A0ACB5U5H7_CANBO|nr:unnamed protein product [[Candida] boidinii]GMF78300.1 unnamed protein product [[Candida] boidinii]
MSNITGNTSSNDLLGSSSGSRRSLSSNQHLDLRFNSQENVSRHGSNPMNPITGSNGNPVRLTNTNHMTNDLLSNYGSRSDIDLSVINSNNNSSNILGNSSIKKNSVGSINSSDGINNNLNSGLLRAKSLKVRQKSSIINPSAMLSNNLTGNSSSNNIQTNSQNRGFRKNMVSEEVVNLSDDDDENY